MNETCCRPVRAARPATAVPLALVCSVVAHVPTSRDMAATVVASPTSIDREVAR